MSVEFLLFALLLMMAVCAVFCIYSLIFEWLPGYLRQRKATAADRATEWVNSHPIKTRVRKIR